jgi:hypothetical protein
LFKLTCPSWLLYGGGTPLIHTGATGASGAMAENGFFTRPVMPWSETGGDDTRYDEWDFTVAWLQSAADDGNTMGTQGAHSSNVMGAAGETRGALSGRGELATLVDRTNTNAPVEQPAPAAVAVAAQMTDEQRARCDASRRDAMAKREASRQGSQANGPAQSAVAQTASPYTASPFRRGPSSASPLESDRAFTPLSPVR